jgi:hypothetical protein
MTRIRMWKPENKETLELTHLGNIGLAGYFTIEKIDAKTKDIVERRFFKNIITDNAMNSLGLANETLDTLFTTLQVGTGAATGSGTPAASDTALNALLDSTTANGGFADVLSFNSSSIPYVSMIRTRQFVESQANGTLTEMGFQSANKFILANRVAIVDVSGNLAPLVKTSDFELRIKFEWRIYPDITTYSGSFLANSTPVSYSVHPVNFFNNTTWGQVISTFLFGNGNAGMGAIETAADVSWSGSFSLATSTANKTYTILPYVSGSNMREVKSFWDITYKPNTGIQAIGWAHSLLFGDSAEFVIIFTPSIPKSSLNNFFLTTRFSWTRQ